MISDPKYRSSKSRMTKQQEKDILIYDKIINYITRIDEEKDAETLWMEMKPLGHQMSISAFNTRLKKLVERGIVEKKSLGYNKNFYRISTDDKPQYSGAF
ncbi:Fe2+ or Zn2+ uptake regulation protein [Mucilaginibacter lappiensis]